MHNEKLNYYRFYNYNELKISTDWKIRRKSRVQRKVLSFTFFPLYPMLNNTQTYDLPWPSVPVEPLSQSIRDKGLLLIHQCHIWQRNNTDLANSSFNLLLRFNIKRICIKKGLYHTITRTYMYQFLHLIIIIKLNYLCKKLNGYNLTKSDQ